MQRHNPTKYFFYCNLPYNPTKNLFLYRNTITQISFIEYFNMIVPIYSSLIFEIDFQQFYSISSSLACVFIIIFSTIMLFLVPFWIGMRSRTRLEHCKYIISNGELLVVLCLTLLYANYVYASIQSYYFGWSSQKI